MPKKIQILVELEIRDENPEPISAKEGRHIAEEVAFATHARSMNQGLTSEKCPVTVDTYAISATYQGVV